MGLPMMKVDGSLDHIPAKRAHVVALFESINQPLVNIPGYGAAPTAAFVLSTRNDHGALTVFIYLYQPQTQAVLIYVSEPRSLTAEQLPAEQTEAITFVESMGFMVDDVQFGLLSPADQDAVMERIPMFRPLNAHVVPGRPPAEARFGALGGVVTGRPEAVPQDRPRTSPNEGPLTGPGLPSGLPPVPAGPRTGTQPGLEPGRPGPTPSDVVRGVAPRSEYDLEPSRDPSPRPITHASFGRGLPVPASDPRTPPLPVAPEEPGTPAPGGAETLARIGRLLGTFGFLMALTGGPILGCAASTKERSRAQEATLDLGNQELARSQWAEALKHFRTVLESQDDDADAHRGAGLAYWRLERLDAAEKHLREAVRLREEWSEPKNELAVILVERRACDEAQTLLAAVLDDVFYPTRHFAEHNLARAEACSGNVEAAVERLTSLTSKRPKFCLAYLTASEVASRAQLHEETVEACESFRENCERDAEIGTKIPDALKATCDLRKGRAYMALGDVESARTAFERCRSAEKTRAACHDALELLPP